jgi:pimeloyl-ACP methyl ester carboxylesterase
VPQSQILLYLHGVGKGDADNTWRGTLEDSLARIGYPDLSGIEVVAPKYPNGLRGVDDRDVPLPRVTVAEPRGDEARSNRRDFERRRTAMEAMLGRDVRGGGLPGGDVLAPVAANTPVFTQAKNYVKKSEIRAWVLDRIVNALPVEGRVVIVGHSLGSVIAADLIRRLPVGLHVAGLVTIGSPLAHENLRVANLLKDLHEPPTNMDWWANFWNAKDLVPTHRGVSTAIPWVLDQQIPAPPSLNPLRAHEATTYLGNGTVALAIGHGLFGSLSREIVRVEQGLDIRLDYAETFALLALRYAHLMSRRLEGDTHGRYVDALRQVQATTVEQITARNNAEGRPMPSAIARLAVDLTDPASLPVEPGLPGHLSIDEAVVPLVVLASANLVRPFEIDVSREIRQEALVQLTFEMMLGRMVGTNVFDAAEQARKELKAPTNWLKWAALGLGATAVAIATGGLALAAAPGVAGAAAVTSALAAFGPGGMIGGLFTAGTLMSAGGSGIAIGLAAPGTTAESAEAVVADQLTTAILRKLQGLDQDPQTWIGLVEAERAVRAELTRLEALSDDSAPTPKELRRKLVAIDRALAYLRRNDLDPKPAAALAE